MKHPNTVMINVWFTYASVCKIPYNTQMIYVSKMFTNAFQHSYDSHIHRNVFLPSVYKCFRALIWFTYLRVWKCFNTHMIHISKVYKCLSTFIWFTYSSVYKCLTTFIWFTYLGVLKRLIALIWFTYPSIWKCLTTLICITYSSVYKCLATLIWFTYPNALQLLYVSCDLDYF